MNILLCMLVPCITMHQYLFLSMLNTLQYIIVFSFPLCIYRTHNVLGLYVKFDTCIFWEWNSVQYIYSVRKKPETCSRYRIQILTCGYTCIMPNEETYMKNSFTMETWYIYAKSGHWNITAFVPQCMYFSRIQIFTVAILFLVWIKCIPIIECKTCMCGLFR